MNIFLYLQKIFKPAVKVRIVPVIATVCPKCKSDGLLHYSKGEIGNVEEFYLCEDCLKKSTPQQVKNFYAKTNIK